MSVMIVFALTTTAFFVLSAVANAYSISGSSASSIEPSPSSAINQNWTNTWNSLSAPFQNFANSLSSINGNSMQNIINPPASMQIPSYVSTGAQNVFQQFDAWLYGIAGFHIATVFTVFLRVIDWVLIFAINIVNWLISLFHIH
jgi:hypothetical protein